MSKKIRWGILSTARIGVSSLIPAVRETDHGEIVAIASRSQESADAFATEHDIPLAFGDYASMLASNDVDAVYNPLPNTLHAEWTALAANQGKHIFCEKPLAVSAVEAQDMIDTCQVAQVSLTEAFVFLFHPQTLKLRELLDQGVIGDVLQTQAHFTFHIARPSDNIRLNKDLGGGGLLDAGVYPITYTRFLFGEEPIAIQAAVHTDAHHHVDTRASVIMIFAENRFATIQTGMDALGGPGVTVFGTDGHIQIPQPYHPRGASQFTVHTKAGAETFTFDLGLHPFTPAVAQFQDHLLNGEPLLATGQNAVGTLRVVEAIHESSQTGQRIDLP
ncbi:MAG: Gfo/Idh/MocA family oxidoreductase [Chloroflexota bacterium]